MAKVKIGFSGLTVPEQVERARLIVGKMTGNIYYTAPVPALVDITAAANALETAYNESRGRDKNKVVAKDLRRKELLFLVNQEGAYVQEASGGNEEKILSSGFDVRGANTPHPDRAGAVSNVRLSDGSNHGIIRIDWNKADHAVMYVVLTSLDPDFGKMQEPKGITTKTTKEVGTFEIGTRVWVKVIPFGREEMGPGSEPLSILVR